MLGKRIKSLWARALNRFVVVKPIHCHPRGATCAQCLRNGCFIPADDEGGPLMPVGEPDMAQAPAAPPRADGKHWSGCQCSDCIDRRLDQYSAVMRLFELFGI